MADMEKLLEQLSQLNVLEVADLSKKLEEKWGVSANVIAPPVMAAQAGGAEKAEEQSTFDVLLTDVGSQKIAVIKEVRAATELGLKEAKDLVESAPKSVKSGVSKGDAETLKKALESAGAKVEIK